MKTRTLLLYTIFCLPCLAAAQSLPEYSARYSATANGLSASASRSLTRQANDSYELSNELKAEFAGRELAALTETSVFSLDSSTITPESYNYVLSGLGSESKTVLFDWPSSTAVSSEDLDSWILQLKPLTQDTLSYQAALQFALITSDAAEFEFPIVDGNKIELQQFRITGDEILDTPLGPLNCIRLIRVRDDDDSQSTIIWLAREWSYLLTKIEQVSRSGLKIVLELQQAEVNGVTVSP